MDSPEARQGQATETPDRSRKRRIATGLATGSLAFSALLASSGCSTEVVAGPDEDVVRFTEGTKITQLWWDNENTYRISHKDAEETCKVGLLTVSEEAVLAITAHTQPRCPEEVVPTAFTERYIYDADELRQAVRAVGLPDSVAENGLTVPIGEYTDINATQEPHQIEPDHFQETLKDIWGLDVDNPSHANLVENLTTFYASQRQNSTEARHFYPIQGMSFVTEGDQAFLSISPEALTIAMMTPEEVELFMTNCHPGENPFSIVCQEYETQNFLNLVPIDEVDEANLNLEPPDAKNRPSPPLSLAA